jgi:DNA repair exonuclease SbcCD ATPase subunit
MSSEPIITEPPISVGEAAERLGISSVRVRHYLRVGRLAGFRDNRGHWRIATPLVSAAELKAGPTIDISAADAADLLVDEILELKDLLAERDHQVARLGALIERQQQALEDAARQAAERCAERDAARERLEQLSRALDRALEMSEQALAKSAEQERENERLQALLARTTARFEDTLKRLEGAEGQNQGLLTTLDRGLDLLDRTTARLALDREARQRLEALLAEATQKLDSLSAEKAATSALLARREAALERSLKLLERMAEAEERAKDLRNSGQTLLTWVWRRLEGT